MVMEVVAIDVDSSLLPLWKEKFIETRRRILESYGFKLKKAIIRPSGEPAPWLSEKQKKKIGKGKGFHCWFHFESPRPLTDMEKLELQFMLGDDYGRVYINYLRITKRKSPHWSKIFSYILWRKPLDEKCQNCSLRKYLEELAKNVDNQNSA